MHAGERGPRLARTPVPPFVFPALAIENDVVAFIEPEGEQWNACDRPTMRQHRRLLRIFKLGFRDVAPRPVRASIAAPVIDGRPLAVSAGKVFFRSSEREMAGRQSIALPLPLDAFNALLSADGRFVAFETGQQLVPSDTNAISDVYVHDIGAGTFERVSVTDGEAQGTGTVPVRPTAPTFRPSPPTATSSRSSPRIPTWSRATRTAWSTSSCAIAPPGRRRA